MNGDGSVNCVAFTPAERVLTTGWQEPAVGKPLTLFNVGGVTTSATASRVARHITIGDNGGTGAFLDYSSDSSTVGHSAGVVGNGSTALVSDNTSGEDRVSYQVQSSGGMELDGTAAAAFAGSACIFEASAIAANGPAPPAGQAVPAAQAGAHLPALVKQK